ncbi:uncharacterized protein LOC113325036 [Papaver somniferum]|uniref:uncharacterized protein LOC113325036 n=1 Tax=Papaver somniferum TaxID=3469 RepID=UPI000E6FCAA2|nr:uncharacterized protein LOC113325036 [Papaver somniferum]
MDDAVAPNRISGFQVSEGGTTVSHLQFSDDTIILLNASRLEVRRSFIILMLFEVLTCLKLNLEKSSMTSIESDDIVQELSSELGCKINMLPITHLGMPIGATKRSTTILEIIIQKMQKKLAPWKRKF